MQKPPYKRRIQDSTTRHFILTVKEEMVEDALDKMKRNRKNLHTPNK